MNSRHFQAPPAIGQSLSPAYATELLEDGEIFGSDDDDNDNDDLLSMRQISALPKRVIEVVDLTYDDDGDSKSDDGNYTEIAPGSSTNSLYLPSSPLPNSLARSADGLATSSTAATPGKKGFPWKNVPPWSLLYQKLQQRSDKSLNSLRVDALYTSTDDLVQDSVNGSKAADDHNDNATSSVLTKGQKAPRPEGSDITSSRSDRSGFVLCNLKAGISSTEIDNIGARPTQHGALMRCTRDTSNTASDKPSASPEIADSNDGRTVDNGTDKRPHSFVFDVFAEDDDEIIDDGQPPAKRWRRASSASSSVRTKQARTSPVVSLPHDVELHADFTRKEETIEGHEWQARRIIGERQTPSGLEYKVSLEKKLWLPKAMLDPKLVRKYRAEQRAATKVRTRQSSRLQ